MSKYIGLTRVVIYGDLDRLECRRYGAMTTCNEGRVEIELCKVGAKVPPYPYFLTTGICLLPSSQLTKVAAWAVTRAANLDSSGVVERSHES